MNPEFVEILTSVSINKTRSEGGGRQIFTLTPDARLEKLVLHKSFDLRAFPVNNETGQALAAVTEFEGHLLSAVDLLSQHILPQTITTLTLADVYDQTPAHLSTFFPHLHTLTFQLGTNGVGPS